MLKSTFEKGNVRALFNHKNILSLWPAQKFPKISRCPNRNHPSFLRPKTVTSSSKAHNMQPLVSARVTEKLPVKLKRELGRKHIRRGRNCTRKTSSLTRLNDVLRKTLLKEAKQNARSNDLVLSSERVSKSKPNRCAVKTDVRERESGATIG